jgi:hypothetical protein
VLRQSRYTQSLHLSRQHSHLATQRNPSNTRNNQQTVYYYFFGGTLDFCLFVCLFVCLFGTSSQITNAMCSTSVLVFVALAGIVGAEQQSASGIGGPCLLDCVPKGMSKEKAKCCDGKEGEMPGVLQLCPKWFCGRFSRLHWCFTRVGRCECICTRCAHFPAPPPSLPLQCALLAALPSGR